MSLKEEILGVEASLGTILRSILSGATTYGSRVNVGLGRSGWSWPRPLPAIWWTSRSRGPANRELRRPVGRDQAAQAGAGRPRSLARRRGCGRAGAEPPAPSG